jgi:hypothetical protein
MTRRNFLKQATQFGMSKETKLYSPVVDVPFDKQNGQQNITDTYGGRRAGECRPC